MKTSLHLYSPIINIANMAAVEFYCMLRRITYRIICL